MVSGLAEIKKSCPLVAGSVPADNTIGIDTTNGIDTFAVAGKDRLTVSVTVPSSPLTVVFAGLKPGPRVERGGGGMVEAFRGWIYGEGGRKKAGGQETRVSGSKRARPRRNAHMRPRPGQPRACQPTDVPHDHIQHRAQRCKPGDPATLACHRAHARARATPADRSDRGAARRPDRGSPRCAWESTDTCAGGLPRSRRGMGSSRPRRCTAPA